MILDFEIMKTKDWIKQLQKLDPEKELYFHFTENGEDWGYYIPEPDIKVEGLEKRKYDGQWLIYEDEGEGKSLGLCNAVSI